MKKLVKIIVILLIALGFVSCFQQPVENEVVKLAREQHLKQSSKRTAAVENQKQIRYYHRRKV